MHNRVNYTQTFQPIDIGRRRKKPGKGEFGEKVKVPRGGRKQGKEENVRQLQDLLERAKNNIDVANEYAVGWWKKRRYLTTRHALP